MDGEASLREPAPTTPVDRTDAYEAFWQSVDADNLKSAANFPIRVFQTLVHLVACPAMQAPTRLLCQTTQAVARPSAPARPACGGILNSFHR